MVFGVDDIVLAGAVSGGLGLLGGSNTNSANAALAAQANQSNKDLAWQNELWQEKMSDTAYQRSVEDMKMAGINPALAYMKGGASTPSGNVPTMIAPKMEDALGKGVSSALDSMRLKKEITQADVQNTVGESQSALNDAMSENQAAQQKLNETNATVAEKNATLLDTQIPVAKQQAKVDLIHGKINEKMAPADALGNRVGKVLNSAGSVLKNIVP